MRATTELKNKLKIKTLILLDLTCRALRKAQSLLHRNKEISSITFYPEVTRYDDLADIFNRSSWYFPDVSFSNGVVNIPVNERLYPELSNFKNIAVPKSQDSYIKENRRLNIYKIKNGDDLMHLCAKSDAILVWDFTSIKKYPRLFLSPHKIWIVDPNYYSITEAKNYLMIFNQTISESYKKELLRVSKENFKKLVDVGKHYRKSFVFCTGPSLDKAFNFKFDDGFNIVCNSIVKNKKLLDHIKPHVLTFGDLAFHFGPSKYAAEFRRRVLEVIRNYRCYCVIRMDAVPLLLAHYPELKSKIIGMPVLFFSGYNFPTTERFFTKYAYSILNLIMLPLASAAVNEIYLLSCDGRAKNEKLIWKHSPSAQFGNLIQTVFETHPSFLRDFASGDYYEEYCQTVEKLIIYGESKGKRYISLTQSLIPALNKRQAVNGGVL